MGEDAAGNPPIKEDNHLKAAEEFFGLARTATNPFMRALRGRRPAVPLVTGRIETVERGDI